MHQLKKLHIILCISFILYSVTRCGKAFLPNNIKYTGYFANLASLKGIEQLYFIGVFFTEKKNEVSSPLNGFII